MTNTQILIVEDEGIIAKDIQNTLESLGYAVPAIASSGEEAIKKATETLPDLALMDILLEGDMDGVEAAEQIRDRFDIPVVYLTAYADEETLQRAKITEPYGYILKPFEERELHTTIEMAIYKHKMERKLRESQQWLVTTLKSIGDAVIATDANGFISFMNPVAEALTGWNQEDAAGKPLKKVFNIINEKTGKQAEDPATRVLREGIVVGLANHTMLITRDGTKHPIDDSGAPIKDDKGNIKGVVLVFRDITEKRNMEEALLKADALESLGILAGGIAHDFNNILTAIMGNITLAKMYAKPEDKIFERLKEAENASLRAKDLTQQLLTFSRGGAPIKKTAFISKLLEDTTLFALTGSNVRCEFSIPSDLWPVEADEGQISQVINNLIINADHAMPGGGIIKVSAENTAVDVKQGLPLKEGNYIKISIEDQGVGIPEEHLQKIFDPYFTSKQKGSGLGLATAYSIVKKHDGYVQVESELGKGTTFNIYLPASSKEILIEKEPGERIHTGKGKILVMDDQEVIREVAGEMIEVLGYEVEFAKDGAEAIELHKKAKKSAQPFDAIIMDLTIPGGMGGKETIQKLIEIDPETKAIVSSGYSNDPIMADYRKYGFCGVIAKPYKIKELGEILYKVITDKSKGLKR
ncbi:MAG: response regulator [Thermodesulfobacteriota bacterium]|nr:response regulator [Thermodesulfobacteriota bacterium]